MEIESADSKLVINHINELMSGIQGTLSAVMSDKSDSLYLSINNLLERWMEFSRHTITNPVELSNTQIVYWQDFLLLCKDLNLRLTEGIAQSNPAVRKNVLLSFIEKFYFMLAQHVVLVIKKIYSDEEGEDTVQIERLNQHFLSELAKNSFIHIDQSSLSL